MEIPHYIDTQCIAAKSLHHLDSVSPVFLWYSAVVNFSTYYLEIFTIKQIISMIKSKCVSLN